MANNQAGFQWGMQGAQMGAQVGGPWGALIGGAAGFVFGKGLPDNEKIMIEKFNAEVVRNAARDMFDNRRMQNQENKRTAAALAQYNDNRKVQQAQINAQFGAAEIIGSSAEALKKTLDWQTNEAKNQTILNAITGIENYNTQVDSMTNTRINQLKRYKTQASTIDPQQLMNTGVQMYDQFKGNTIPTMMDQFKSVWSGTPQTPKAIEMYDPRWKNTGNSNVLAMFNSEVTG